MMHTMLRRVALAVGTCGTLAVAGCGLLDVDDPTRIDSEDLDTGGSADLLRKNALAQLNYAIGYSSRDAGAFSDEFAVDPSRYYVNHAIPVLEMSLDRRDGTYDAQFESDLGTFAYMGFARRAASIALPRIAQYMTEPARSAYLAQMYAVRGFATMRLGEDFCAGYPLHEIDGMKLKIGDPVTRVQALERALADFDSANAIATDSTAIVNFVRVGRGRTLMALGRFDEAAAAVAGVETGYVYRAEFSTSVGYRANPMAWNYDDRYHRYLVGNHDGGVGLDFVAANDPRLPRHAVGLNYSGADSAYIADAYQSSESPIVAASGVEARLIEAEVALKNGQTGPWLTLLNGLRTMPGGPGLSDTTDPGTDAGRLDLMFRERAFWLYGTGHRLSDLRRLVDAYGRSAEDVFPHGTYRNGGVFGTAVSEPFPVRDDAANNPAVTGCTDR